MNETRPPTCGIQPCNHTRIGGDWPLPQFVIESLEIGAVLHEPAIDRSLRKSDLTALTGKKLFASKMLERLAVGAPV